MVQRVAPVRHSERQNEALMERPLRVRPQVSCQAGLHRRDQLDSRSDRHVNPCCQHARGALGGAIGSSPMANAALRKRGSLSVWQAGKAGKRGRPETFSGAAVQVSHTLKMLFGLPLRQTVGLVESLIRTAALDGPVPDYSTLCRRQARLGGGSPSIPIIPAGSRPFGGPRSGHRPAPWPGGGHAPWRQPWSGGAGGGGPAAGRIAVSSC